MDLGTQRVKAVVLKDDVVVGRGQMFAGFDPAKATEQAVNDALKAANLSLLDVNHFTATGSAMDLAPHANNTVSMMGADAKAGVFLIPQARTVIDIGAEEARAVKCDARGLMMEFVVNERCAAGAGAFIEAMARALEVKLDDMGLLALKAERASPINASCVIFGESDVVSLIHRQESKPEIARAVFDAMADRISSMIHRLGINPEVVLVGGVAKDPGFVASLNRKLDLAVQIPEYPEYAGALGAALIAATRAKGASK
ncbi:MAG: acyl-CoA dehydratase activase [Nitrososphaerota archaeon]|jgi:benzoyl-CoA reductase subunit D|uniref:acyl-CoA dehydratase activase n=1 Tax=Candidatus Bathycorpusculum sp. TaxID=2994959 RepID=UPI00281D816A|nr:acyl-CoA dehydratase activase [Candidatus Termitimicrobium sp.]MCL2432425.1 acyl-CoA dehydratase activase [Candidatus Termitimicrobium sp.]MDR0492602.1 acyl-CoA dehydratase activase [Nitrososphaerota archaeon]